MKRFPVSAPQRGSRLPIAVVCSLAAALGAQDAVGPRPQATGGFVENRGQWPLDVHFRGAFGPLVAWIHADGWTLHADRSDVPLTGPTGDPAGLEPVVVPHTGAVVRMTVVGGRARAVAGIGGSSTARHNFLFGNDPSKWATDLPAREGARLAAVLPGVDAIVRPQDGHFEYDLEVAAGVDLGDVVVRVDGVDGLAVEHDGSVRLATAVGSFRQLAPIAWVERDGGRQRVRCAAQLVSERSFRFVAPERARGERLVVDPGIVWGNLISTPDSEYTQGCRPGTDAAGNVYIGGLTTGLTFPATTGAYQSTSGFPGTQKAWLAKFAPNGTLLWSTYLGGTTGHERTRSLHVTANGVVTACGATSSFNFPQVNAHDPSYNGTGPQFWGDAWLARLDPAQSGAAQLTWSTFFGGSSDDRLNTVQVDANGVVTASGWTYSTSIISVLGFTGGYQLTHGGVRDGMIVRLDPSQPMASQLLYFTFFGGTGDDYLNSTLLDANGVITVDGATTSTNLPTTANAYAQAITGPDDQFVARIDPSAAPAAQLLWSTYIGDTGVDFTGGDSVMDAAGVVTTTAWCQGNFPTTPGAFDTTPNGGYDVVVYRLDPSQSGANQLVWSTLFGGTGDEGGTGIRLDATGGVLVIGTNSNGGLPTTASAFQPTAPGGGTVPSDVYVARFDRTGSQLVYSSYLGGALGVDYGYGIIGDACGNVFVHGLTQSADFPATSGAALGMDDVFLAQLDLLPAGLARFGAPTAGCLGTPQSRADTSPAVGNAAFALECIGAPPATIGLVAWGSGPLPAPIPVLGIDLWVDPLGLVLLTVVTDLFGACTVGLAIPNNPTLVGAAASTQFAFFQPCPTLLSSSCGLTLTIQ